jgi:iron complex outermembrane receptor protein
MHKSIQKLPLALAISAVISSPASLAAPDGPQASDGLEEIVVTGQRREETLKDAAVAVNVFGASALEAANVTRPGDVLKLAPNVTWVQSNQPGEFYVTIRGNTQTRLGDSSVALVIDGVQSLDQNSINQELFDIEKIEVLKGPQGALYGRNAIGGAIVINTKAPNTENWEGKVKAGAANGSETSGQVGFSGPLSSTLAVRGGVSYRDRDGFYDNDITGENVDRFRDTSGFLRAIWQPSDTVTGDFRFGATDMKGGGINWNAIIVGANAPVMSGDNTDLPYVNNIKGFSDNTRKTASMKWDFDFDAMTLTSVSSYADLKDNYGSDSYPYFYDPGLFTTTNAATQNLQRKSEIMAQELRLASNGDDPLQWLVGVYYAEFDVENRATTGADTAGVLLGLGPYPFASDNQTIGFLFDKNDNKAYAAFANLTYDFGNGLELAASIRYDKEKKDQTDYAFAGAPDAADPAAFPTYAVRAWRDRQAKFDETQPKLTARYTFTDEISGYASWGRGFKTGGFNPFGTAQLLQQFNPASTVGDVFPKEVADTWEVGAKSVWLDGTLMLNLAYFDTQTDNSQLLEFFPAATLQAISTADKVDMSGFEIELIARPADGLSLTASYGYLDAETKEFSGLPPGLSYVGNKRPSTSPDTLLLAADYSLPLGGSDWELLMHVDYQKQGKTTWDWADTPGAYRSSFDLLNARIALQNEAWQIAAWGKNLTDESYNAEHIVLLPFLGALYRAAPRQYGLEVSYSF